MATLHTKSKKISASNHDENSAEYQRGMMHIGKQPGPMADSYVIRQTVRKTRS